MAEIRVRKRLFGAIALNLAMAIGALFVVGSEAVLPAAALAVRVVADGSPPAHVSIDAVRIAADVVPVGLTPEQAMVVPPFGTVGWYDASAAIGERGAVVLVGHVDSRKGPDVFFGLRKLAANDVIQLVGTDGVPHLYAVREKRLLAKTELPPEIFDRNAAPGLWLITCGGAFNRKTHSYESNQLVYAVPIEANAIA